MEARLLYRDGLMLVLDKPAGLPVHRGPKAAGMKNVGALEDHFGALRFGLPRAPSLAHRLDRETSGCLVLGRHRKALESLAKLFQAGKIGKTYWALVEGGPEENEGTIDLPLGRRDENRGWWMKVDPAGQPSVTTWKVMGRADGKTWLALEPVTGRTHQLRVHCQARGWPIVGDSIYGTAPRFGGPILHLLAREIVVPLYKNRDPIRVTAPVPPHMREGLKACGWVEDDKATCSAHSRESGNPAEKDLGPRFRGDERN
ncbi:tRNA pseudouridine32 synthase/23S rRNA pseudouridine746 synthase [Pseudorhodoplanes sinuspersici]|nr:tRNA pseudouridine32 synthase/23S rRNA pseudouridine746 synthase [Pseudorhodoplanes sinuspersici]